MIQDFSKSILQKFINSEFGLTSSTLYNTFSMNNMVTLANEEKKVNILNFKGYDFSVYSKFVFDFYKGYDINLGYSGMYGSGRQIFLTNYKSKSNISSIFLRISTF